MQILKFRETHLRPGHYMTMRGYCLYSKDGRVTGGVCTLVRSHIFSEKVPLSTRLVAIAVRTPSPILTTVCNMHVPPDYDLHIHELQDLITQVPPPFLLVLAAIAKHISSRYGLLLPATRDIRERDFSNNKNDDSEDSKNKNQASEDSTKHEEETDKPGNEETNIADKLPEEPTTCCMSGCANCVWIQYAEEMSKHFADGGEEARKIILEKVQDPNMRAFLLLELKSLEKKKS